MFAYVVPPYWVRACMAFTIGISSLLADACADDVSVQEARVEPANGVPRLLINGEPVLPLIFFPNTDIPGEWSRTFLKRQVTMAADVGVHIYSFPYRVFRPGEADEYDYARADADVQAVLAADPKAVVLLRMFPGPSPYDGAWPAIPDSEKSLFGDGTTNFISFASEYFRSDFHASMVDAIRHAEASPYGHRVIGYHVGGPEHEMFMDSYRAKGPDYSVANTHGFRAWLRETYGSDRALQKAWGRADVTVETASVPEYEEGRFPMHGRRDDEIVRVFYERPAEQDWIDYSRYVSDTDASLIEHWAALIKKETERKKLTTFFYGYTMELCGSFSGHYRNDRILACPDVDILASPYSYMGRLAGEPGGFMSLVDTITAHGKLWFNEDDTRTSVLDVEKVPKNVSLWAGDQAGSLEETIGMLERNFAAALVHRTGTWWMDLLGGGAFDHPELWKIFERRAPLYREVYDNPTPYRPEVAMIVDEAPKTVIRSDWDANFQLMITVRNEAMKSGASVGFYSLADFMAGIVPPCALYIFPNAFVVSDDDVETIHRRLDKEGATALWLFAPGSYGAGGFDAAAVERVTGIAVMRNDGLQGSAGAGPWEGLTWGMEAPVAPRPVIDAPDVTILGRYRSDSAPSAAETRLGNHRSIYAADMGVTADLLRTAADSAGAHIWTRGGEVIHTDGRFLMVHRKDGGRVTVSLPPGVEAKTISGAQVAESENEIVVQFEPMQSVWLRLLK